MCSAKPDVSGNDFLEVIKASDKLPTYELGDLLFYAQKISRRLTASSFDKFLARSHAIGDCVQAQVHIVDSPELDPWIEISSIRDSIVLAEILGVAAVATFVYRHAKSYFDTNDFIGRLADCLSGSLAT
jgi:hypothetical protein